MTPHVAVKKVTREEVTPARVVRRFRVIFNAVRTHFRQLEELDPAVLKRLDKDLDVLIRALHADESAAEIPLANL